MRREKIAQYEKRIDAFLNRLKGGLILEETIPLTAEVNATREPVTFAQRLDGEYRPIEVGDTWGREWQSAWFHITGVVPASWQGRRVVARINVGGEACLFDADGCPIYGLTNGSVFALNYGKDIAWLFNTCEGGESVDLWVEAAASTLFGIPRRQDPAPDAPDRHGGMEARLEAAALCIFDEPLWHLMLDIEVLQSLMLGLAPNSPRRLRILRVLNETLDAYADDRANAPACRDMLAALRETPAHASDLTAASVGHAHIDTGWMWPVSETIRKCARTFSSQLALIDRYPDYVFGASQPQHYQFMKDLYPALYEKIKAAVKGGRWELQGGMWVEADCNIISGESMVRQFVHGKNFFMDEFGVDVRNLWLPDVFGYSSAMPQILKKAGVDFFVTQKISWSQFNEFPHHTFKWRGIDGSEVVTHFPPENTYNSALMPERIHAAQERFNENDTLDEFLVLFGIGDGGGGPKEDHVEHGLRMADLEGCPKVRFGRADAFLDRLRERKDELETWFGELYLELHRGTLTTQARTKLGNRRLEGRLREVEFLCSCLPHADYPSDELDAIWKRLLINQFHDIIPGSSIKLVYETTEREYAESLAACDGLIAAAADKLLAKQDDAITLFNTLSSDFTAPIRLPDSWGGHDVLDAEGKALPAQQEAAAAVVVFADVPAQGFLTLTKGGLCEECGATGALVLENELIRYEFAGDGTLTRAFDKEAGREVLAEGAAGNVLSLYEDRPNNWDAWDVDFFYEEQLLETARGVSVSGLARGAVRQGVRFELAIGKSRIVQNVRLAANSKRLDFETTVDWAERHRMLRVAFPTSILSTQATFDIQYGMVRRNTHRNDTWDMAKFEVAAHHYADLSDLDYGVALLNDCKYGHKVHDHVLDLNLLRSPTYPDADADLGTHAFTYGLLPHCGGLIESDVQHHGAMLNQPPVVLEGYAAGDARLPVTLASDGIALEVVKKAEKEPCTVIRLVETQGRASRGVLHAADTTAQLVETDLMEWHDGDAAPCAAPVALTLKPFEIRTYKIRG